MDISECQVWEFTPRFERRWVDWISGYHGSQGDIRNDPVAITPLSKPLSEATVALITTAGVHTSSQVPFDLARPDGDWSYRAIPSDIAATELTISHSHYNHADADQDVNCIFPIDRIREARDEGVIGNLAPTFFGLMGFIPKPAALVTDTVPQIIERLHDEGVDVVIMSPS